MAASATVTVRIEVLDQRSDRDLAGAATLMTAARRLVLGDDEPPFPPEAVRFDLLRAGRPDRTTVGVLGREGARPVGLCTVGMKHGQGNERGAWMAELWVTPSDRRRGIGSRLLAHATDTARAGGRSLLVGNHDERDDAGRGFAAAHGGTPGVAIDQNRVAVDALDRALLERWNAPADGYSLVTFDDVCPGDLIDELARVMESMNDAPRSPSAEDAVYDAQSRRSEELALQTEGARQWVVCARHDGTGELAGMTELSYTTYRPWMVHQGTTVVDRRHRGHGIGRWLKAVNALRILDERPESRVIETTNDGTNAPMLAINREMGFRPVVTWQQVELRIDR